MVKAPIEQQRKLLELQRVDSALARVAHERRTLPVLSKIEDLINSLGENKRRMTLARAAVDDARRVATRADDDVAKVVNRAGVLRDRLNAGGMSPKDLSALQGEIDQLGRRQGVLEEAQLEAMEAVEKAQQEFDEAAAQEQKIREEGRELTAKRDAAFQRLDMEATQLRGERDMIVARLDTALVADYDAVREETGGLGVVALYGRRIEDDLIPVSPQELASIMAADQDEVIHSQEAEVIIVRMTDAD
ncbi:zinc ribbon domain-containing protein [Actinomyces vulturis]|uniref:zinc ribbon domain-containing protein n=1 Tax=Actinomyces vulturis TaxID=1857645 RepID=UPI000831269F|nr:hypothetical protein [Actinomyces vulturis]